MPSTDRRFFTFGLLVAGDILLLDQLSKWLILRQIGAPDAPAIRLAPFFDLAMVWNKGISFGLLADAGAQLFTALSLLIVGILLGWLYRNGSRLAATALGLVIGGALGNVVDRLRFGAVADFLDVHIGPYHWPAFNLADSAICIGVVLLCVSSMLESKRMTG